MKNINLKNIICPMCGGVPDFKEYYSYCPERYEYYYLKCDCGMRTEDCTTKDKALEIWTRRYIKGAEKR